MYKLTLFALIYISYSDSVLGLNLCGKSIQYQSSKCIKVIEYKATEEEALKRCTELESTSSLITIHSGDEQRFLNNLLLKYNKISGSVWIGMKYINSSYKWMDGSETNFTNWADDAVKDGTDPCVQMSIVSPTFGKWTDESCRKTALIVCEKKPELNLNLLRESIEIIEKKVENILPMGFLYTQLPEQSSPQELWPDMKWAEVTAEYSGLFFRAEGNGSSSFGEIQHANQSWISNINDQGVNSQYNSQLAAIKSKHVENGQWVNTTPSAAMSGIHQISFFTTEGEVRPKNTAVRIWKRIQ